MPMETSVPYATALLRISLGTMYLAHSIILKLMTFGLAGTAGYFVSVGLPGWLAYVTFAAEAIGGALLVFGIQTRAVALTLIPALAGAIIWVHGGTAGSSPHRAAAGNIRSTLSFSRSRR